MYYWKNDTKFLVYKYVVAYVWVNTWIMMDDETNGLGV